MAYDSNAAYQPPRRGYGGYEQPQQAPVQNGFGYGGQPDYGYDQGQQHSQEAYGNGGYEQDIRHDQRAQYNGGYDQGYGQVQQQLPRQHNGHAQPPMREERQYDPRYQQRAPAGRPQDGYAQQQAHPQQRQYDPRYQQQRQVPVNQQAGYEQQPARQEPQHNPGVQQNGQMNGYGQMPPRDERQYDPRYEQQPQGGRQVNGYEQPRHDPRSQQQPQIRQKASCGQLPRQPAMPIEQSPPPAHGLDFQSKPNPGNIRQMQMEQQKQALSKQRAQGMTPQPQPKPVQAQSSTQANHQASPPRKANPSKMTMEEWKAQAKAKMHADAARPETLAQDNAFPTFPTYEHKTKGSTSTSATDQRKGDEPPRPSTSAGVTRPPPARDNSSSRGASGSAGQQTLPRPSLDHKPFSFDAVQNAPAVQSPPPKPPHPQYQRSASNHSSPVQERAPQNWPTPPAQQPMPSQVQPQPQPQPERRQAPPRAPQVQPIDVRQAQEQRPTPAYMDHQPLSPASVPQRPSTAQGGRPSQRAQRTAGPPDGYFQAPTQDQQYNGMAAQPPKPFAQQQSKQRETLSDIYDDYHNRMVPPPAVAPDRSREEEIEAEMPDFDSAAPGGTSLLHKKKSQKFVQPANRHAATSAPPMPRKPPHQPNDYGPPPGKQPGGITHGFAFGIPGEQIPQQQPYDDPYQQQDYPQHQQRGAPVQPPFANEHVPRRSMDDARQMPYRQAPPIQQRPSRNGAAPNGHAPRGPMPQHMRPEMDRGYTNATVRSDPGPGQYRGGGSAPPMRQGLQGPPPAGPGPNGAPLTQQRSDPSQPNRQQRHSNPDALPAHPMPVRPGLMEGGPPQAGRPAPTRNYNGTSPPAQQAHPRQPSIDISSRPVTHAELDQLRATVSANPNNFKASTAAFASVEADETSAFSKCPLCVSAITSSSSLTRLVYPANCAMSLYEPMRRSNASLAFMSSLRIVTRLSAFSPVPLA